MPAQVLRANPATVTATFVDTAGATVDPGVVTVDVTRLDGTAVVTDAATTSGSGAAARTYTLTAAQTATLDTLTVTFTSTDLSQSVSETVEVIGALLFTVDDARAFGDGALANASTYPAATIERKRFAITERLERICGVSFVPRYRMDIFNGTGNATLQIPKLMVTDIRSVEYRDSGSATWTAFDADDLADLYHEGWGYLLRETRGTFLSGRRNIRVGYEYGYDHVPEDITTAALLLTRYELVDSNFSGRTISSSTEFGSEQYWTPGLSGRGKALTKLPAVDEILWDFINKVPVVA